MSVPNDVTRLLDDLETARAAATPGPWRQDDQFPQYFGAEDRGGLGNTLADANAALIVAAVNALPDLIAEVRRGRAFRKDVVAIVDEMEDDESIGIPPNVPLLIEALRAALAPQAGDGAR